MRYTVIGVLLYEIEASIRMIPSEQSASSQGIFSLDDFSFDDDNIIMEYDSFFISMYCVETIEGSLYVKMCGTYEESLWATSVKAVGVFVDGKGIADDLDMVIPEKSNGELVAYFHIIGSDLKKAGIKPDNVSSIRFRLLATFDNGESHESAEFCTSMDVNSVGYYDDNEAEIDFSDISSIQDLYDSYIDESHWLIVEKRKVEGVSKNNWYGDYCFAVCEFDGVIAHGIAFSKGKFYKKDDIILNSPCYRIYSGKYSYEIVRYLEENGYDKKYL